MSTRSHYICFGLLLSFMSCGFLPDRIEQAGQIARSGGFSARTIDTGMFRLKTFHKGVESSPEILNVYIEGDGMAWIRRKVLSSDPTPDNPLALRLASRDPRRAILYIARPCQYLEASELENCPSRYWSSHRYAQEVIMAVNAAIDHYVKRSGARTVNIVGYSGGGSVAVLAAARRSDVHSLVTVAANLDHEAWTAWHGVSPLSGSLNATSVAATIQDIPQYHYVGTDDEIVPLAITESYRRRIANPSRTSIISIPGFNHDCCWVDAWPEILCENGAIDRNYCHE